MFWNKKKEIKKPIVDKIKEEIQKDEELVFECFPLFSDFEYMGVKLKVVKHQYFSRGLCMYMGPYTPDTLTQISCDYVDLNGVIRYISFRLDEMKNLIK